MGKVGTGRRRGATRGFTMVELIVCVVVLGILAGVAMVATGGTVERARDVRAQSTLRDIATAVMANATLNDLTTLDRAVVVAAMEQTLGVDVTDGVAAGTSWYLGGKDFVPTGPDEFSVAFAAADGTACDTGGLTAVLATSTGTRTFGYSVAWADGGLMRPEPWFPDRPTAEDYLDNDPPGEVLSDPDTVIVPIPEPTPTPTQTSNPDPTPEPEPDPPATPGTGGWVDYAMPPGWEVTVEAPTYAGQGTIVVTAHTPLTNRELTNERVRVAVTCMAGSQTAHPVNSKDWQTKSGLVVLEREFRCDDDGGFASLTIAPSGRLDMAQGTWYPSGHPFWQ